MNNPRLYFSFEMTVAGTILIPYLRQNKNLDKFFKSDDVRRANAVGYNAYTEAFIASNCSSGEAVWSENYEWNPETKAFNFNKLSLCTSEDYDDLLNMKTSSFDETKVYTAEGKPAVVKSRVNLLEKIKKDYPCPSIEDGFYVEEKNWNFLVRNIIKHVNTILIGPTGTGKTELIMRICENLNIPCRVYDMGSMQDPLTDLLGSHRLENGTSTFDYAKFVSDVQTPGVIILDELSRAPLMTNNILFPCLDSRRTLPIEIADSKSDRTIKVHPECTFIATANIGSEYAGTTDIDAALLNRFIPLQLDYLPSEIEQKIVSVRTGIDESMAEKLITFVNTIRTAYASGELTKSVSTREVLACAELIQDGFELIEAVDFIISNKYINNNYNNEYSIVKKLIMGF